VNAFNEPVTAQKFANLTPKSLPIPCWRHFKNVNKIRFKLSFSVIPTGEPTLRVISVIRLPTHSRSSRLKYEKQRAFLIPITVMTSSKKPFQRAVSALQHQRRGSDGTRSPQGPSDAGLLSARQRGITNPSPVNPNFDRSHESGADEKPDRNKCATRLPQNKNETTPKPGKVVAEQQRREPRNKTSASAIRTKRRGMLRRENQNGKRKSNTARTTTTKCTRREGGLP
jgi:hypothetical protein